jgi:hypothetical protein
MMKAANPPAQETESMNGIDSNKVQRPESQPPESGNPKCSRPPAELNAYADHLSRFKELRNYPRSSPGAYRARPGRLNRVPCSDNDSSWIPSQAVDTNSDVTSVSIIECGVSRGSAIDTTDIVLEGELVDTVQDGRLDDLPLVKATEVDPRTLDAIKFRRRAYSCLFSLSSIVVVAIAVGAFLLKKDSGEEPVTTFDDFVRSFHFSGNATIGAKALNWLEEDLRNKSLVEWRVVQRYALAVLYFSFHGEHWVNSTGWYVPGIILSLYRTESEPFV